MVIADASALFLKRGGATIASVEDEDAEEPAPALVVPEEVGQGVVSASGGRGGCSSERKEQGTSRLDMFPGVMGAEVGESG